MESTQQTSDNENIPKSPKEVLANLEAYYQNKEIIGSIERNVNFKTEETFFESLKTFLNDKEDAHIIDMLFNSSIDGLAEEMDLYKRAEQSIIKTVDRPVFLINNDQINIGITTSWEKHIEENLETISKVIPAIGRIEITGDSRRKWAGTGWLLKDTDIIVTNRHVARHFAKKKSEGVFEFKKNYMRRPVGVKIDFKEEQDAGEALEFDIKKVLHIAKNSELDIALLRVQKRNYKGQKLPEGLEISYDLSILKEDIEDESEEEKENIKKNIYVVGYPACSDNEELRTTFFNGVSEVKQFAPGALFGTCISKYIYYHDCTTWGGNSGSPLLDFTTGKVLGIHYAGTSEERTEYRKNYAVSVLFLIELLEELGEKYNYRIHPDKK
ncbi:trypsin-like peptidase domain-containing protein [Kordia sp. YSTF-M3]|uniref:Trypsin-like peptidase domain-containing protein n=1 Tax=Kordia aestuariivivens TaxID=2759037 RepID=A0ABR7Q5T6_9FLAO|nr:serine protease [Kordia aestuariivivens]MBC8753929.1 trypsin-like peptidase domain-containing protein [Kordia aestuariivivens]